MKKLNTVNVVESLVKKYSEMYKGEELELVLRMNGLTEEEQKPLLPEVK